MLLTFSHKDLCNNFQTLGNHDILLNVLYGYPWYRQCMDP